MQYRNARLTKIFREVIKLGGFDYAVGYLGTPRFQRIGPIEVGMDSPMNYFVSSSLQLSACVQIAK